MLMPSLKYEAQKQKQIYIYIYIYKKKERKNAHNEPLVLEPILMARDSSLRCPEESNKNDSSSRFPYEKKKKVT